MKKNLVRVLLVVLGWTMGTSCEKDDDIRRIGVEFSQALNTRYPGAVMAEWERKSGYYVAEFYAEGRELKVWYNRNAEWCMTETDLGRGASGLPQAVSDAFTASAYGNWAIDDIDKYERPGETFYLIEVEKRGERDRDLYYSPSGMLLKDDYDRGDVLPTIKF